MRRMSGKRIKLSRKEREIEEALFNNEYVRISPRAEAEIVRALQARKKDAVLNLRVNSHDLILLKRKAKRLGIKYQTFISELLHRIAQS